MNPLTAELTALLNDRYYHYNTPDFIAPDPISIPHRFSSRGDIEIAGLLVATIAWGRRDLVLRSANRLLERMDRAPYDFVLHATASDLDQLEGFVHRTFNAIDARYFVRALQHIYCEHRGLEAAFADGLQPADTDIYNALAHFRGLFFSLPSAPKRTGKHVSDVTRNASCKRLAMFLRWMVRQDKRGVDFGLWQRIAPHQLVLPLDVHTGRVTRALGLLKRKQNDWKAVREVTAHLRQLDPTDPAKYDFAIFGLGIYEDMGKV